MDKVEERKRKRNERRREAYQSMQPEDKAKLLERRRQRYGERMVRLRSQLEIESGTSPAQENQNFSEAILAQTSTPPCISKLQNVVNEYPTNNVQVLDHAVSDDIIHELMPDPTYTNEYHSPPRNRHYDRFSRLKSIATSPWELPVASQCQFCQAYKFFREPPAFCCANGEVSLAPMTPNPILLNLFTVDTSGIGIRFRRRVRTYNNHLALTSIGMKTDPQFCWSNQGIERNSHSRGVSAAYCAGENSVAPALGLSASTILEVENQVYTQNRRKRTNVSCREHTAFRCQIRGNDFNCIIHAGRLGQQYSIDSYIKIETQRLDYYRMEQQQFDARIESLQGIVDSLGVEGLTDPNKVGQRIVLPSSFIGGPRDMMKRYVNAMALVQKYGNPDLFITMTCNPNWKEIKNHLLPIEEAQDRPDLVARVFRAKLEEFKNEVVKNQLFGEVAVYVYVVEYQKRGLPHAHWIIILKQQHKLSSPELYDKIISAELPNDANS